jgi:hypothetical protein
VKFAVSLNMWFMSVTLDVSKCDYTLKCRNVRNAAVVSCCSAGSMSRTRSWSNALAPLNMKENFVALDVFQKVNGSLKAVFNLKTLSKFVTLDTHLSALHLVSRTEKKRHTPCAGSNDVPVADRVSVHDRQAVVQSFLDCR